MKASAVRSLRSLTAKIHPPLSLNPRESQQLLSLLTSSFRRELNREHPSLAQDDAHRASHGIQNGLQRTSPVDHAEKLVNSGYSSSVSTDRHFEAILTNPLFARKRERRLSSARMPRSRRGSWDEAQRMVNDPMGWFEEKVSLGEANVAAARNCLEAYEKVLLGSPEFSLKTSMQRSGAGAKVLSWVRASGLQESAEFLSDRCFIRIFVRFLVAEGLHSRVLQWLELPVSTPGIALTLEDEASERASKNKGWLLFQLVKAEMSLGSGIDEATETFLRAVAVRDSFSAPSTKAGVHVLGSAGGYLTEQWAHLSDSVDHDVALFDAFAASVKLWSFNNKIFSARIQLHHPTAPSTRLALRVLENASNNAPAKLTPRARRRLCQLGLETAQLLLDQRRLSDGTRLMDLLQTHFAAELGVERDENAVGEKPAEEQSAASLEATNLHLLEGLDLQ
ncbi:MAG: hypothetical protein M1819_003962 [Sarea resinae]|nr:MAG: hypothetical protein M1819_003962 [Sarea resinae]